MPLKYCTPFSIFERVTRFSKSGGDGGDGGSGGGDGGGGGGSNRKTALSCGLNHLFMCVSLGAWGLSLYKRDKKTNLIDAFDGSICILLRSYQVIINFKVIVSRDCQGIQMILMDRP